MLSFQLYAIFVPPQRSEPDVSLPESLLPEWVFEAFKNPNRPRELKVQLDKGYIVVRKGAARPAIEMCGVDTNMFFPGSTLAAASFVDEVFNRKDFKEDDGHDAMNWLQDFVVAMCYEMAAFAGESTGADYVRDSLLPALEDLV